MKCNSGFSLIEVLVVFIIISIMATLTIHKFREASRKAKAQQEAEMATVETVAVEQIPVPVKSDRLVISYQGRWNLTDIAVFKDTTTQVEYLVLRTSSGVTVTPMVSKSQIKPSSDLGQWKLTP